MSVDYKELTNKELEDIVEVAGITVEAKNSAKPNKTELVDAIEAFNAKNNKIKKDSEIKLPDNVGKGLKEGVKRRPQTYEELQRLDLFTKDRVIINDRQENQTKDESVTVSWGNRTLGGQTDIVPLHNDPQYVRRGALNNLRDATTRIHDPSKTNSNGAGTTTVPRFIIQNVEGLTQKELDELGNVQRMRNSKSA